MTCHAMCYLLGTQRQTSAASKQEMPVPGIGASSQSDDALCFVAMLLTSYTSIYDQVHSHLSWLNIL